MAWNAVRIDTARFTAATTYDQRHDRHRLQVIITNNYDEAVDSSASPEVSNNCFKLNVASIIKDM